MSLTELSVNFFVALFALIDPIGNVALFAAATLGATGPGRRRLSLYIAAFSLVFLGLIYFTGLAILQFFGVSMAAFRIAGGILLFLLGLDMARDNFTARLADEAGGAEPLSTGAYARERFERLVVPFAMPLLIGPGAISTVITAVSASILAAFWMTGLISRVLGRIGMTIIVRILGLILCAMAVQFIIAGVAGSTSGLVRHDAVTPYATR